VKFLRVAICYHYYIPEIELDHGFDTTRALNPMTAPFKIAFDKAFSEVRVRETHAREITISSVRGTVDRIFIFSSDKERLNGTERDDFIVYYRVFIEDEMDANTVESLTPTTPIRSRRESLFWIRPRLIFVRCVSQFIRDTLGTGHGYRKKSPIVMLKALLVFRHFISTLGYWRFASSAIN